MAAVAVDRFVETLSQSQILAEEQLLELGQLQERFPTPREFAQELLRRNWLTAFQISFLSQGKAEHLLLGQYILLDRIGEGGMGEVFKARQRNLDRIVALKVIRKESLDNPRVIQRFQREIRAAGQLSHPNIVHAYDADQLAGQYFIAMEYIDGADLAQLVKQSGPLQVAQACEYIRQAALGLQHAHECGLIHRDIKPHNLLVTHQVSKGRMSGMLARPRLEGKTVGSSALTPPLVGDYPWGIVKILDLGLARWHEDSGRANSQLTQIGTVMGTPDFIAPEQARNSHTSDIRADLYSLGCTLYFLLSGRIPYPNGTLTEKLLQHQFDEPEAIELVRRAEWTRFGKLTGLTRVSRDVLRVPAEVIALVKRLMAKRPDQRPASARELADALTVIQDRLANAKLSGELAPSEEAANAQSAPTLAEALTPAPPADEIIVLKPVAATGKKSRPGRYRRRAWATIAGGLVLGLLLAALAGRSTDPQASPTVLDPDKIPLTPPPPEAWRQLVDRVQNHQGNSDDLRLELIRYRSRHLDSPLVKNIPALLASLASPLDALDRNRIAREQFFAWQPKELVAVLPPAGGPLKRKPTSTVALSPDGWYLAAGQEDGLLRVWDMHQPPLARHGFNAHVGKILRIAYAPDGNSYATAGADGKVKLWDVKTNSVLCTLDHAAQAVPALAYHPDGQTIATGCLDGKIRVWDTSQGVEKLALDGQAGKILSLAYSPDGKTLVWGGDKNKVRWADTASLKPAPDAVLKLEGNWVRVLALSPDGQSAVVGGTSTGAFNLATWSTTHLKTRETLTDHHAPVNDAAYSPDGKFFATVGDDRFIRIWNATLGKPELAWEMNWTILGVAFASDNRHLATANSNGTVYVFRHGLGK